MADLTLEPGDMPHRVRFQSDAGTTQDTHGQKVESFATYATRWARVQPRSGLTGWRAQQLQPRTTHLVTVRAGGLRGTVGPTHRVLHRGRTLNVVGVIDVEERGVILEIECVERT